ncbi:hypothetical protein B0T14DRAFT_110375 [Immersiella caudata]|uniref:Ubiquitin interaction domain-containing protein n=1 Tax=Immersiella caudata TaxID=314043 RepID=A0AA39X3H1_9PEZI|nr:hypothetical protein B0T14DRAFT_110375 [Immersiella caudata]
MAQPSESDIVTVMSITGLSDRSVIVQALQSKDNNVEAVMNDYFDSPENFSNKYSWDEDVFGSSREGDSSSANNSKNPSFAIHPAEGNQVIYGSDPGYYGTHIAPSRPPSRANNRSPIARMVDMTTSDFPGAAPNSQHDEDALVQQAMIESLKSSNSPQGLPPPPPQQSGVTPTVDSGVHFGPANRDDYKTEEWAMVPAKRREPDPDASARKRNPDTPVFLRCRDESGWASHRVGGVLTILHNIPAARNALLRIGIQPDYGYGNNSEWWKGTIILPPDRLALKEAQASDIWEPTVYPPWSDEIHRLVAFLDNTERSYGTADILAEAHEAHSGIEISGDRERDFFQKLNQDPSRERDVFRASIDAVTTTVSATGKSSTTQQSEFTILLSEFSKDQLLMAESLYSIWDMMFFTHTGESGEGSESSQMASITKPSEVLAFRIGAEGLPTAIEIPETLYIDRYLSSHLDEMRQIQKELVDIHTAYQKSRELEQKLTQWVNPKTGKAWDRRVMDKVGIKRCQERITQIKNRACWRNHEQAHAQGDDTDYYLPDHEGDPTLLPEEAEVVAHYEAQVQRLEANLARIDQVMNDEILPRRKALEIFSRHVSSLLTVPSSDPRWNPTHRYTLRGVINDHRKVFIRKRETSLMELDEDSAPAEQWWKLSCEEDNGYMVASEATTFEAIAREACGIGCKPILIYATESAMDEAPDSLPEPLKTFVRFDNRHFKMELTQAEAEQPDPLQEMSHLSTLRAAGLYLKKKRSTDSMDSMATNQASAGDIDEDMRDASLDGGLGNDGALGQDPDVQELVDTSVMDNSLSDQQPSLLPTVSPPAQEMQERANVPLMTRPLSGIFEPTTTSVDMRDI